jgi:hypothetical protein
LRVVFQDRCQSGSIDLEATEMALRSALHRAGAAALSQLLQFPAPRKEGRTRACPCVQQAHYREQRSKPVLTALGPVEVLRPYYLCARCGVGQFPVDVELDIENTEFSPGVRRMQAVVGQEAPFAHGRAQMKVLAGLEVTTESVERTAEAIGTDIAQREQAAMQKALQLELPVVAGEPIPVLYVQMDGTGVPVVKKETVGRARRKASRPIRGKSNWDVSSPRRAGIKKALPSAIPIPPRIPERSRVRKSLAGASMPKPADAAGAAHARRS